uniref:Uncharacterized protein n=1 Tax=Megaselia scalaris TaxID=36166 RepID=T1GRN2_MEGSC
MSPNVSDAWTTLKGSVVQFQSLFVWRSAGVIVRDRRPGRLKQRWLKVVEDDVKNSSKSKTLE